MSRENPTPAEDLALDHLNPRVASLMCCSKCKQELDWSFRRVKPEYHGDRGGNWKGLGQRDAVWVYVPCHNEIRCPDPECKDAPSPLPTCKRCQGTGKKVCGWRNPRTTGVLQQFARGVARAAAPEMLVSLVGLYHDTRSRAGKAGADRDAAALTQASARLAKVILSITGLERREIAVTSVDEGRAESVDRMKEELIRQLRESQALVVQHEATMEAHGLDPHAEAPASRDRVPAASEAPPPERG